MNQKQKQNNARTCLADKQEYPREELLRFVVSPAGELCFDVAEKLDGRGLWLRADAAVLEKACAKNIFNKAAHQPVRIPADLKQQVERALRQKCLELMGLCRKAGLLVGGFEAVRKSLAAGQVSAAYEARDAAEDGQKKLFKPQHDMPVYALFTRKELGQIMGEEEAVHVAALRGPLAEKLMCQAARLNAFCASDERKDTLQ